MRRPGWRALLCAWLIAATAGVARADRSDDLARLREAIAARRERVSAYERKERGLLAALEAIEETAALLEKEVRVTREDAARARQALARAEADAADLSERVARTERAMSRRAVALYKVGELGAMPILFSAGDLRDFLSRVQTLRRLLRHDATLLARHHAELAALEASRQRAAQASAASAAAERSAAKSAADLAAERGRKRSLVAKLRSSRARERAALAEYETAARALEETLAALPAAPEPAAALPAGTHFESLRGHLPAPVDGAIAAEFGRVVDDRFQTETFRKGVEFAAPLGTPVRAVAAGQARFAGRFRGYGNLVILDHGAEYFTVYAHLDRIDVAVGQAVAGGARIGSVGDTGTLSGPHLYFEVRRGSTPLDPRAWLGMRRAKR
jgi:murein hydrolase activator